MRHITCEELGAILADFVFLPDDNFVEQAQELIRVLKADGFEITKLADALGDQSTAATKGHD